MHTMIYLDEIIDADSFTQAVESSSEKLRNIYHLPKVRQLGMVVADAEKADKELVASGLLPFFLAKVRTNQWLENGVERSLCAKLGIAYREGIELELIEPVQNADFYARDIDPQGRILIHHFGFIVQDIEGMLTRLADAGAPLLVRGKLNLGLVRADFAYMDTRLECGVISELISIKILGFHASLPRRLMALLARLQQRSGMRTFNL